MSTLSQNPQSGKPVESQAGNPQELKANISKALSSQTGNRLYKSRGLKSFSMFTGQGKPVIFVNGLFQTSDEHTINYLDYEIKLGHPDIFIDPNEPTFDPEKYDPRAAMRREIMLELEREGRLRASGDPNRDMGSSVQGPLMAASTKDIAPVAAGGASIVVGSKK